MNPCRFSLQSESMKFTAYYFFPASNILMTCCIVWILMQQSTGMRIALFPLGALWIFYSWRFVYRAIMFESREFFITKDGIGFGGPFRETKFYYWEKIHEISIWGHCPNNAVYEKSFTTVICVFLKPKPDCFSDKIQRGFYPAKHMDTFLMIDYSDSTYDKLRKLDPGDIPDYRPKQFWGFDPETGTYKKLKYDK